MHNRLEPFQLMTSYSTHIMTSLAFPGNINKISQGQENDITAAPIVFFS